MGPGKETANENENRNGDHDDDDYNECSMDINITDDGCTVRCSKGTN